MNYQIKVYDSNNVFKFEQNIKQLSSDIGYSANTGGGQGRLSMELNVEIDKVYYDIGDLVKIYEYSDLNKSGRIYYYGTVQNIELIAEDNVEKVNIEMIGIFYLLNKIIYNQSGRTFTKNDDPANIATSIITCFNSTYGNVFTVDSSLYGSSVSIKFENQTCLQALDALCDKVGWYWYCGADAVVRVKPKPNTPTHYLTYKRDIQNMNIKLTGEDIYNRVYVDYTGGSQTYNNVSSQSDYGLLEIVENKSDIQNLNTANDFGNNYVSTEGVFKQQVTLEVNNLYDIGLINPGDTIKVRNSKYPIDNLQILKVSRELDKISLELDYLKNAGTLGKILLNK